MFFKKDLAIFYNDEFIDFDGCSEVQKFLLNEFDSVMVSNYCVATNCHDYLYNVMDVNTQRCGD